MSLSKKRKASSNDSLSDAPLPAPSTSRTLRPRSRAVSVIRSSRSRSGSVAMASSASTSRRSSARALTISQIIDEKSTDPFTSSSDIPSSQITSQSEPSSQPDIETQTDQDQETQPPEPSGGTSSIRTPSATPKKRSPSPKQELLSEFTCPICFFPPTNATLTPCGHICCGACLFTAVKSTMERGAFMGGAGEANVASCPVCRAQIMGWDGRGGGVIGLKLRTLLCV